MSDARDWRFPAACPNCLKWEGVPTAIASKTADRVEVWVRCCRCANEWRITANPPQLILKQKQDRRSLRRRFQDLLRNRSQAGGSREA